MPSHIQYLPIAYIKHGIAKTINSTATAVLIINTTGVEPKTLMRSINGNRNRAMGSNGNFQAIQVT